MGSESSIQESDEKMDSQIPPQYLCALTQKLMCVPVMTITTGKVYDYVAIQKWIESGQNVDPTNGIPLCIQQSKDAAFEFREDIKNRIDEYLQSNPHHKAFQSMDDIKWSQLFEHQIEHISWLKSEYKQQQKRMTQKAQTLFSAQRVTPGKNDDDLRFKNPMHRIDFHDVSLRMDIPIITWMGPSKHGKSTLLNDILGAEDAFQVLSSPNTPCTRGAWVALYKKSQHNQFSVDGDEEIINVPRSVTKGAPQNAPNKKYDTNTVDQLERFGYSRRKIMNAMDVVEDTQDINAIIDYLNEQEEKSQNEEMEHEMNDSWITPQHVADTKQMYLVDMEGLSHSVAPFTKKLFYACYAISNVIVWNDKQIGSDAFKTFMEHLATDMQTVAQSQRKPCLLYLNRDCDPHLDFTPYHTLDEYMKQHESFKWLRDMNIFGSIHCFQLHRRPYDEPFDKEVIQKLVDFILNVAFLSSRFVENVYDMKKQIDSINETNVINLGLELIFANDALRGLLMHNDDGNNDNIRRSQIIQYAEKYNWDKNKVEEEFNRADDELVSRLIKQGVIDNELRMELVQNKNAVIERIDKKNTDDIIKIALIVTSPITVPIAIIVGLASAVVIVPYLAGTAIYDKWIGSNQQEENVQVE